MGASKILIEPYFLNNFLLEAMEEFENHPALHLFTLATIPSSFHIRITHIDGEKPDIVKLCNIKIRDQHGTFLHIFSDEEQIMFDSEKQKMGKREFKLVFPQPGLYWLELTVEPRDIETQQRTLDGNLGRGWSKEGEEEFLRQPIIVLSYSDILQLKLNRLMYKLTFFIGVLTFLSITISILSLVF